MATLCFTVVSPYASRKACGMKDVSLTPFGMLPSLHDSTSRWSKSRLRVSNTPITWMPSAGSPWNGMLVACMSWAMRRSKVVRLMVRSPAAIKSDSRLIRVYILNTDSWKKASSLFFPCCPIRLRTLSIHLVSKQLVGSSSMSVNRRDRPSSMESSLRVGK